MNEQDKRIVDILEETRAQSPDRSRKTAAAVVLPSGGIVSVGWNHWPQGTEEREELHERPAKYLWIEHAERAAIYQCAKEGESTEGCTMYCLWYPCADCARSIIFAGIAELKCFEPDWNDPKWAEDFAVVKRMLTAAGVKVTFLGKYEEEQK